MFTIQEFTTLIRHIVNKNKNAMDSIDKNKTAIILLHKINASLIDAMII